MNETLDFYQQQAKQCLSALPWLAQIQAEASTALKHYGFPTRRDEDWKYTQIEQLIKHTFTQKKQSTNPVEFTEAKTPINQRVLIKNGNVYGEKELMAGLPAGVLILTLGDALKQYGELIKPHLGKILQQEHGFHFLNTAMIERGLFIYIPAGISITEPIAINHTQDKDNEAVHLRHLILMGEGSRATLVEEYSGEAACCYLTNTITEIFLDKKAVLTHYKIQQESKSAFHIGHVSVKQSANSHFYSHVMQLGGHLVRSDMTLYLQGEKAHCLLNGIYATTQAQHVDQHTTVHHLVPKCSSDQDYKGIMSGQSRAVFNGKVVVAKDAQHTDAKQQNKNLLLSAQAEVDTKPQLEIFADDVLCSHGATVGQLDEDALFYMATRGIDRVEAMQYLIHAFAQDNLDLIPCHQLADCMANLLNQQLG